MGSPAEAIAWKERRARGCDQGTPRIYKTVLRALTDGICNGTCISGITSGIVILMTTSTYQPGKLSPPFRPAKVGDRFTVTRGPLTQNFVYIQGPDGPTAVEECRDGETPFTDEDRNLAPQSLYHSSVGHPDFKAVKASLRNGLRSGAGSDIVTSMNRTAAPHNARVTPATPATDKQKSYIRSLLAELEGDLAAEAIRNILNEKREAREVITKETASATIKALLTIKGTPDRDSAKAPQSPVVAPHTTKSYNSIPEGSYALRDDSGVVKFYEVNHGKEGTRWDGYTFLAVRASDDRYSIKNRQTREGILDAILADPKAAAALYGHELGECAICHRSLTDEASRAVGIGPVCAAKAGWA